MNLNQLQNLQYKFDKRHGWIQTSSDSIELIMMINKDMIGLFGEIGEFANIVKKLNLLLGRFDQPQIEKEFIAQKESLSRECIDSFIYIIRIANDLGINLEALYIEKQKINEGKFQSFLLKGENNESTEHNKFVKD